MSGTQNWIEHRLIKPESVERRDYQAELARTALKRNTLIVLPTGLGKTTIALLVIAETLATKKKKCLFLAPTRVLVNQHYEYLRQHLQILDVSMLTGENDAYEREKAWDNSVICATPQITLHDMERQMIRPEDFSLVIFDEAHRTVGNYAYAGIASLLKGQDVRLVGMTATMPSGQERANEIVRNLEIKQIEVRDESSPDVKSYVQETNIEWVRVEMPPLLIQIRTHLRRALEKRTTELREKGIVRSNKVSASELIRAREYLYKNRSAAKALYTAIRLSHALNIFDTQGITSFLRFCKRLEEKRAWGTKELFFDPDFRSALDLARKAEHDGIEHPKLEKLASVLSNVDGKILVFTSYRDSVEVLHKKLNEMGFSAGYLIGKAGERGLKQKEQVNALERFRDGEFDILVATQVGEEGLDISECNLVVFYDNVPSAIRFVQRKGRTGRKAPGRVVVLITKDTLDEVYFWVGKRKMQDVKSMVGRMNRMMTQNEGSGNLDVYF